MTDRELLELAARAGGYKIRKSKSPLHGNDILEIYHEVNGFYIMWSPLTNDGDALRLAVNIGLYDLDKLLVCMDLKYPDYQKLDNLSAVRRAIVLAAAEIGKAVKRARDYQVRHAL